MRADCYFIEDISGGITKVQLHADNERLAVLLPQSQSVEIWNLRIVTRLHRLHDQVYVYMI